MRPNPLIAIFVIDFASPERRVKTKPLSTEPFIPARDALPTVDDSTQHADVASERCRHDLHRSGRDFERAIRDRSSHRLERVRWLMLPDRSTNNDEGRAQRIGEPDGEAPEGLPRARHDPLGSLVPRGGGLVHPGRLVHGSRRGGRAYCCERLDAPVASATAARSLERDGKVT